MKKLHKGEQDTLVCECEPGFNPDCEYIADSIHHVVYRSGGGTDVFENLVAASRSCHDKSHGKNGGNKHKFKAMWRRQIKHRNKIRSRK